MTRNPNTHYIRHEWLQYLTSQLGEGSRDLCVGMEICCSHFNPHDHVDGKKCWRVYPMGFPGEKIDALPTPPIKRMRFIDESIDLTTLPPEPPLTWDERLRGHETEKLSIWLQKIQDPEISLQNTLQILTSFGDISMHSIQVDTFVRCMLALSDKALAEKRMDYLAFQNGRPDLYFWTGYYSLKSINSHLIHPAIHLVPWRCRCRPN